MFNTMTLVFAVAVGAVVSTCAWAATNEPGRAEQSSARRDTWTIVGPGGGGAQFRPVVSPFDASKVFVSCDMTGLFVTEDAGASWRMINLRGVTRFVVFDPLDENVVYAKSVALWRSADGGATWHLLHPSPEDVKGVIYSDDHAQERMDVGDKAVEDIEALAVDPADSKTLYGVFSVAEGDPRQGPRTTVLRISTDSGKTWKDAGTLPAGGRTVAVDPRSPVEDRTVYVVTDNSVSVRQSGEWTHHDGAEGVQRFNGSWIGFPEGEAKPVVYGVAGRAWRGDASSTAGIHVSRDGGESWQNINAGLMKHWPEGAPVPRMNAVAASPTQPDIVYLSYRDAGADRGSESQRASQFLGVARSDDGGRTWALVWRDTGIEAAENYEGVWIDERYDPTWGDAPFSLGVAPSSPDICYATDFGRTVRTLDGGATWKAVSSKRVPGGAWTTTGLDVSCCYALHFDPHDIDHCFISYTDIGLMVSRDGTKSWDSATRNGVPTEWYNATYWMEFDPEVKGLVWAAMSGIHDLPRPKMWRNRRTPFSGGIMVSTDGGDSWKKTGDWSAPRGVITHILLDPKSPAGNRTLYAAAFGGGVLKSVDNGKTWVSKNAGITQDEPFAWRIWRGADDVLYLVVFRESEDGSIGDGRDGAVYRSTDNAEHWEPVALPAGVNGPTDVALDENDASRIVLSAWGRMKPSGDVGGGIYLSTDQGKTWRCVLEKDQHIHDLTFDPRNGVYYACGHEGNAWRSGDGGETWTRIKGYNFKWGRKVVPDPKDPDFIYVSTFGGSLWYGPAEGDPDAVEDIVTPGVAYGH